MPSDPEIVLRLLSPVFESLTVPFVVGGSIAGSVYGIPRATQDIDILAVLEERHVSFFFEVALRLNPLALDAMTDTLRQSIDALSVAACASRRNGGVRCHRTA